MSTDHGCPPAEQKPFEGDRYERLRQAVEILAEDENVASAELPYNGEGLRAFAADLTDMRALDGLSDHDADWAGMVACFDFCRGLPRFGWRINDMLSEKPTFTPRPEGYDNELAVLRAYVNILGALLEPFADIDEEADDAKCPGCAGTEKVRMCTGKWTYTAPCPDCRVTEFDASNIDPDHFIVGNPGS